MNQSKQKKSLVKETLKIFWRATAKHKVAVGVTWFCLLITVGTDIAKPLLMKNLVDVLSKGGNSESFFIAIQILFFFALIIFTGHFARRVRDWAHEFYLGLAKKDLTQKCFAAINNQSFGYLSNQFTGTLVKRLTRYERAYETLADQVVWGVVHTALQLIGLGFGILILQPFFLVSFLGWLVCYVVFVVVMVRRKQPKDRVRVAAESKMSGFIADAMSNYSTIKSFAASGVEKDSLLNISEDVRIKLMNSRWAGWLLDTGQGVFIGILEVGFLLMAIYQWKNGLMTVGEIIALQAYITVLAGRLWDLGSQIRHIDEAFSEANEMTEILLQTPGIRDVRGAKSLRVKQGQIEFKDISFDYDDDAVQPDSSSKNTSTPPLPRVILSGFSLKIAPKEKLALVGPSGGGKSTITKLLFRFYDVNSGSIKVDGQDIAKVTQDSLRQSMSLVPQEPILFHRSLKENIRYGKPDATDEEVIAAAKKAHAHEFISKFGDGYDTLVGERGVKLSGGERQRIAIARAILKNAPILVLDEATSALDSESELLIQDALKKLMKDKTVIVIAHRLSTIMQMDRIVVIENGTVKEEGKHKELLKMKDGMYQKLWGIQAGGFA